MNRAGNHAGGNIQNELKFWGLAFLLNFLLFLPWYLAYLEESSFFPHQIIFQEGWYDTFKYLVNRGNQDIFRICTEFTLLLVMFFISGKWVRKGLFGNALRRKKLTWFVTVLYGMLFIYQLYYAVFTKIYQTTPVFYNDLPLVKTGFSILFQDQIVLVVFSLLGFAGIMTLVFFILGHVFTLLEKTKRGFISYSVITLLIVVISFSLFRYGLGYQQKLVIRPVLYSLISNVRKSIETKEMSRKASFDEIREYGEQVNRVSLNHKPNLYLIIIESYGKILYEWGNIKAPVSAGDKLEASTPAGDNLGSPASSGGNLEPPVSAGDKLEASTPAGDNLEASHQTGDNLEPSTQTGDTLTRSYLCNLRKNEQVLNRNGWHAVSCFSISPITGGASWISYGSMLYGLNMKTHGRFDFLINHEDFHRNTHLLNFFRRKGYKNHRLSSIYPHDDMMIPWEKYTRFYAVDEWITYEDLQYSGKLYGFGPSPPDQYALNFAVDTIKRSGEDPHTLFFITQNSHNPFYSPDSVAGDWKSLNKGSGVMRQKSVFLKKAYLSDYLHAIQYQLDYLSRFISRYPEEAVFILVGDHQPPGLPGSQSRETILHIVSRDSSFVAGFRDYGLSRGLVIPAGRTPLRHEGIYSMFLREFIRNYGNYDSLPEYHPGGFRVFPD